MLRTGARATDVKGLLAAAKGYRLGQYGPHCQAHNQSLRNLVQHMSGHIAATDSAARRQLRRPADPEGSVAQYGTSPPNLDTGEPSGHPLP